METNATDWSLIDRYNRLKNRILKRLGRGSDGELQYKHDIEGIAIAVAMHVGRTSTKVKGRGQGLPKYEEVLNCCSDGELVIRSGFGWYEKKTIESILTVSTTRICRALL